MLGLRVKGCMRIVFAFSLVSTGNLIYLMSFSTLAQASGASSALSLAASSSSSFRAALRATWEFMAHSQIRRALGACAGLCCMCCYHPAQRSTCTFRRAPWTCCKAFRLWNKRS